MDDNYSDLCGITQDELEYYFAAYIEKLAIKQQLNSEECLLEIIGYSSQTH